MLNGLHPPRLAELADRHPKGLCVESISSFLKESIFGQDFALDQIAATVLDLVNSRMERVKKNYLDHKEICSTNQRNQHDRGDAPSTFVPPPTPLIRVVTMSGVSGCGKTETSRRVANLLGVTESDNTYLEIDMSVMTDSTQTNQLTGGGIGLVGYEDGNTLADKLNMALSKFDKSRYAFDNKLYDYYDDTNTGVVGGNILEYLFF